VRKFKGGQSNPTYRIDAPSGSYVLRRKPFGKLLPSAHAVDREHRVQAGLAKTGFPVAPQYGLCTDDRWSDRCSTSWAWSKAARSGMAPCPAPRPISAARPITP
jgi:aminoglycoside phosphotransferase (APT) family kinase protein